MRPLTQASNTTGYAIPVTCVHSPLNVDEVIGLVLRARKLGTPLYPVSGGLNWGYGSSSPVTEGCQLVDLRGMNKIRNADEISVDHPVAVIEPGVTQDQLYRFLEARCPALTFNVTGSGKDTSILGNCLDRGVGYLGPRKEDIFGLEFVDGTGRLFQTGFRRLGEDSPLAHSHPYGLGPILDGLHSQSNFGIVTSACFKLVPRRPKEVAVSMALRRASDLGAFVGELGRLKREGLMSSVTHVGNKARTRATLTFGITGYLQTHTQVPGAALEREVERALDVAAPHEWTALASVSGNAGQVRATLAELRRRIGPIARVRVVTEKRLNVGYAIAHQLRALPAARARAAAIAAIRPLHSLAVGVPTDVAIANLLWEYGRPDLPATALDESNCGLLYISPALPSDGPFVAQLMSQLEQVAAEHGHVLYTTINIETSTSMVAVINLLFDRSKASDVAKAHRCARALLDHLHGLGLEVYRARVDMMEEIVSRDQRYWDLVASLKSVFDPAGILAPGRYGPV